MKPPVRRCRVCGCSQHDACPAGCSWVPGAGDLCSVCGDAIIALRIWMDDARKRNWTALLRETKTGWPIRKQAPCTGGIQ